MALTIRPALPTDREAVVAFCAHIWDGHDYVPAVWDEWVKDPQAVLLAAVQEGVAVAVARAIFPVPGEAWLEGMRVDPHYRGAGIARDLSTALVEAVERRGARAIRLLTMSDNYPIHRICERLGLRPVLRLGRRMRPLEAGPTPEALRQLGPGDLHLAREILSRPARGRRFLEVTGGLYSQVGGIWVAWNEDRLTEHLARGEVWTWEGERGPRAIAVVSPHRRRVGVSEVGLLEGPGPDCKTLLAAVVRRAAVPAGEPDSEPGVRMHMPVKLSRLQRAACQAGYHAGWRGQMIVFEKRAGKGEDGETRG
jgi:GNAT superfamily N-acetyltransferase